MREFPSQKQILVIESDQDLLDELKADLMGMGLEIKSFSSGVEALNSLKEGFPDFILTPFDATGYEGNRLTHSLAKLGLLKHIPVIVTGHESIEQLQGLEVFSQRNASDVPRFVQALAY